VLTVLVGLLALGAVVSTTLPISLLPSLNIPQITVQVNSAGMAAAALERTVTSVLRNQLLQVNRLKDISSNSQDEQATIRLDFEFGTNTNLALLEVNEKIDQIISQLPRELERPRVLKASVTDIPVFYVAVVSSSSSALELANFSQTVLKRRIEQLPQIAFVDRSGYATPQITLQPKTSILQGLGLTIQAIETLLRASNVSFGSVLVQDGQYQYNIRLSNELQTIEKLMALPLRHEGQVIPLSTLAEVRYEAQPRRGTFQYNGKEAIVFAIRKQADAQLFDLKNAFGELLTAFEADYPSLQFHIFNDQSALLEVSIDNLRTSLGWGALFAIVVMFLFYRGWRAPILIGVAIPVALVMALLGFYLLDISINIISLSGLILGVGLMIDNSIIVIDNIYQYRATGLDWTTACVRGANEVIRPLISSALTTCSVFVPLIFLSGIAGALFYDQAMSIAIALTASLLVAYILLPTLLRLIGEKQMKNGITKHKKNRFATSVDTVLNYRWAFTLLFLILLVAIFLPLKQLVRQTFPNFTRNTYTLTVDWNEPIGLLDNQSRIDALVASINYDVAHHASFIGEQQFLLTQNQQRINQAEVLFFLNNTNAAFVDTIRQYFQANFPTAQFSIQPTATLFDQVFGAAKAALRIHVQSAKNQEVPSVEQLSMLKTFLAQQGVEVPLPATQLQYEVSVLREKALLYEIPLENILKELQILFKNYNVSTFKTSNEQIPIMVVGETKSLMRLLQTAQATNVKGEAVALYPFIQLQKTITYKSFTGGKGGVAVDIDLPFYRENLMVAITSYFREDPNLTAYFSGQYFEDQQLLRELLVVLSISLLLLYLILAAQFESLIQPLIVLLIVPLGLLGAMVALWWSGQSINLVSIIGIIVMTGIIVNDAILKVDMINRLKKSMTLMDAIHEAGTRRLYPIIMTSVTTILALLPVLFASGLGAELQQPLAYAVIGGLMLGTLSSLYFVPMFYYLIYHRRHHKS
jgi:multidrug efflux pump subunit AcrB